VPELGQVLCLLLHELGRTVITLISPLLEPLICLFPIPHGELPLDREGEAGRQRHYWK